MEYKVSLEKFSGPLDLLLSLIEEKKLAISEISLSAVTDQFLEYLKKIAVGEIKNRKLGIIYIEEESYIKVISVMFL